MLSHLPARRWQSKHSSDRCDRKSMGEMSHALAAAIRNTKNAVALHDVALVLPNKAADVLPVKLINRWILIWSDCGEHTKHRLTRLAFLKDLTNFFLAITNDCSAGSTCERDCRYTYCQEWGEEGKHDR